MLLRQRLEAQIDADAELKRLRAAVHDATRHAGEICVDKAVAHLLEPTRHPLPAPADSPERILAGLIGELPRRKQRRVIDAVAPRLRPEARSRYGALAKVDLTSPTPVLDQARQHAAAMLPRPDPRKIARLTQELALDERGPRRPRSGSGVRFQLRLHEVECLERTRELAEGRDEMRLEAFGLTAEQVLTGGGRTTTNFVNLGNFREGDVRQFGDEVLVSFGLEPEADLPQGFLAVLRPFEKDRGVPEDARNRLIFAALAGFALAVILPIVLVSSGASAPIVAQALVTGALALPTRVYFWVNDDIFTGVDVPEFLNRPDDSFPVQDIVISNVREGGKPLRGRYRFRCSWAVV